MILCVLSGAVLSVSAAEYPRLWDDADLLTPYEESALLAELDEISERQKLDVVVVTVNSTGASSPMEYADDFFDYNGYGYGTNRDGILLLISMEERDWWISTCGYGITAFTDAGMDYISEQFLDDLSSGYYADAFQTFASLCDAFITQARGGQPYDVYNLPKEPFDGGMALILALIVGLITALIYTGVLKGQLHTVRRQASASDYMKENSMQIRDSRDIFLYRNVSRTLRQTESSGGGSRVHTSSSGASHGGRGGKF